MKLTRGAFYLFEAVDHFGHLGDWTAGDMDKRPVLPGGGWYMGDVKQKGVTLAMFLHIGFADDKDTWTSSFIIKDAIVRARRVGPAIRREDKR